MLNMIKAVEITQQSIWESFVKEVDQANFLSSWNWGVFHQRLDKKVFYRGYYLGTKLIGLSLIVKESARRGSYLTIAGGPLLDWSNPKLTNFWRDDIKSIAQNEKCVFVRVRPQLLDNQDSKKLFAELGFNPAPMHLTADDTLQLDLSLTEEELLSQMRKNTRYEIRKADKVGITVTTSQAVTDIKAFYKYQLDLAKKHSFIPFSYKFLKEQFSVLAADNQVLLFHSYSEDKKLLASAFVIMYGNEAVYHYGISTPENNRLPGSYACQWAAIKEAKNRGIKRYNFWGITPADAPEDHRFAGVSLFKKGFGGNEVSYLPAQDLQTSPWYIPVKLFEMYRAKKRHLA